MSSDYQYDLLDGTYTEEERTKLALIVASVIDIITSERLMLGDNEVLVVAFSTYASMVVQILEYLKELELSGDPMALNTAETLRDASLLQVQKYIDLLLSKVPRRGNTVN